MSQLPFLSADQATADTFSPISRSPMQKLQRDHGAQFETRDGWEVAVGFPDEAAVLQSAGIVELPHLGKLDVRGAGARPDAAKVLWYQMTPQRALCITLAAETSGVRASLEESARRVVDVSAGFGSLALLGPRVGELLRRVTELENFPASGIISHIHGHVLTIDGGFLLLYPQEYGQYLYEVLLDAAVPFDGGPVGVDALPSGGIW